MYNTLNEYQVAVAEYLTGEFPVFSSWFGYEDQLASKLCEHTEVAHFIRKCYEARYLPAIPAECLHTGTPVTREIASYSGSHQF